MQIDVIIMACTKSPFHRGITEQCLKTLDQTTVPLNVKIMESCSDGRGYVMQNHFSTIIDLSNTEFGYNKFANIGARMGDSEYICICNNDLEFSPGWAEMMIETMQKENLDSASPYCPYTHVNLRKISANVPIRRGYRVGYELTGWCIMLTRKTFEAIGGFDEDFSFWCCDNAYAEQLKEKELSHALVCGSRVTHMDAGSKTLNEIKNKDSVLYRNLTFSQVYKFNKKYNQNLFGMGTQA